MNLVDTHCHINMIIKKEFDVPLPADFVKLSEPIIQAAESADVTTIINVGTSLTESKNCIELARSSKNCFATVGIHPNDLKDNWQEDVQACAQLLKDPENKVVGIGEIGLDYHYPGYNKERQHQAFKAQIELALVHDLPIVVHTRDAQAGVLDVLEQYQQEKLRGIIHCFSEDQVFADRAIALGFVLGIGGPLTYPQNDELRAVFKTVPLNKIVLETDAPFLPPQVIRGKKNSPAHIRTVAQCLAELRGVPLEEVAQVTTHNTYNLFNMSSTML